MKMANPYVPFAQRPGQVGRTIDGLRELNDALLKLPKAIAERHLRLAVGAGAQVIRKQVLNRITAAGIQKRTGTLERSVYVKAIKELSKPNEKVYFVGVRQGKRYQARETKSGRKLLNRDSFYFWWLEFGTSKMPARPFLRPAFETKKEAAVDAIAARIKKGLDTESKKLGKK